MKPSDKRWPLLAALVLAATLVGCATPGTAPTPRADEPSGEVFGGDEGATVESRYAEALDLMRSNQFADAQAAFEGLVADAPEASGPLTNLGILHLRAKRLPEARSALLRAVAINPRNAVAWNELGRAERELNSPAAARDAYRKAIEIDDSLAEAHLNLGLVLDQPLRDTDGALQHYRRYMALSGNSDLRVLVWIAELEQATAAAANTTPTPQAGTR